MEPAVIFEEPPFQLPELSKLQPRISAVLSRHGVGECTDVLARRVNDHYSTFDSEIVTCRLEGGAEVKLLCKYGSLEVISCYGHRGGTPREIQIYENLLQGLPLSRPIFYGKHLDPVVGEAWLFLEYLEGVMKINKSLDPMSLPRAAEWIGHFHALAQPRIGRAELAFLDTYNVDYYQGWSERTANFAGDLHERFPWLNTVCRRFKEVQKVLLADPPTVIHGEYVTANVLIRDTIVYPVDWESAAIAAGEIDLVMITDGWDEATVRDCIEWYHRARWPSGAPHNLAQRIEAARLYVKLRWLGDRPEWTTHEENLGLYGEIYDASKRLGIL